MTQEAKIGRNTLFSLSLVITMILGSFYAGKSFATINTRVDSLEKVIDEHNYIPRTELNIRLQNMQKQLNRIEQYIKNNNNTKSNINN